MMSDNENFPKRLKISENFPAIQPGCQVRLVNLPAHPGLEGVVAKVLSFEDDNFVEVEIRKTKIVKRIKRDKVRPILVGCVVELHGLVSAYKLNGRIGECTAFDDEELFRYSVLLSDGVTKKVKPENVRFLAKYDSLMVTKYQIDSILEISTSSSSLRDRVEILTRANRIVPDAVSVRVLMDYLKLDSDELREKLLKSKRVSVSSLVGSDVKILYVSLPRSQLVDTKPDREELRFFRKFLSVMEDAEKYFNTQVYLILPFLVNRDMGLPTIDRAVHCSYPLFPFVADGTVLALEKSEKMESLSWPGQRMDLWLSRKIFDREVFVFKEGQSRTWSRSMNEIRVRAGLASRGHKCADDDLVKEIEKSLEMTVPTSEGGWVECMLIN